MTVNYGPSGTLGNYLPENIVIPLDQQQYNNFLKKILEDYARFINRKETGSYDLVEQVINEQYFGANNQTKRNVYRKVFQFGAIAPGVILAIPHGVTGITMVTGLYGFALTNVPDERPIPYVNTTAVTNQIATNRDALNIIVRNGATAPPIVSGFIVFEYLKN